MALSGLKVIEFAGLAPGPFAGLVLADNGAIVTRIDRPSSTSFDILCRGKRSIIVDSKNEDGRQLLRTMIASADVLIDPFRPGVLERLGLGPDVFLGDGKRKGLNERLIYARLVGFPRTGPYKDMAGHDINYLALSGVLAMFPGKEKPSFPLNIVADFAGGGLTCAVGILLALAERSKTGKGQVVNTDMVSGTRYLSSFPLSLAHFGSVLLHGPRGTNVLDGGAPFYGTYTCKDGRWMSVGCLEPQFFKVFIETFVRTLPKDFDPCGEWKPDTTTQTKREEWPMLSKYLTDGFMTQPRDYWAEIFHGTDACAVPVLSTEEAAQNAPTPPAPHPIVFGQGRYIDIPSSGKDPTIEPGLQTEEVLKDFGFTPDQLRKWTEQGVVQRSFRRHAKL